MCSGLKVRFQASRGVVAGSHQLNIMTLKVGSFAFRLRPENIQEPMSKYPILLAAASDVGELTRRRFDALGH